ncbi:MAG: YchF/TatD family DNA exonuclease [Nitrospiraceae bacterium]|nr:MAG: YchF/TatD family DNA exonuclease [Nitrospiraceae bacterium]
MIDTHCHLEMEAFDDDREEAIKRAGKEHVKFIINAGSDRAGNLKGLELSSKYQNIYSAVGIHPHDAKYLDKSLILELRRWLERPKIVAIGEIGLDYHYLHSPKGVQVEAFIRQIAIAQESDLPIIVHSREAKKDTIRILREEASGVSGVLHCFSGDIEMAKEAMGLGFYISIAGPVTFKNAKELKEVVRFIPDDFLLIETDAPYLSPVPMRGKRNEPSFLRHTADAIAEIRGINVSDLARITTLNAMRLFRIGNISSQGEITYRIRDSLYLNITNKCTNKCGFCVKSRTTYVKGHNLRLEKEPSALQLIKAIHDPKAYKEIVFCGIGEPLLRLDIVKKVSSWIKQNGGKVRINTNGQGNLIHGKNILPDLKGIVDSISISLDAEDAKKYEKICKPAVKGAFEGVISFIKEAVKVIPEVKATIVKIPGVNVEKCRKIADDLGVELRIREFDMVG